MQDDSNHQHNEEFDGFTLDELKQNFGALAEELEHGGQPLGKLVEKAEEKQEEIAEEHHEDRAFQGYNPTIKDFLARATTVEECEEIIDYCLRQGDISDEEADELIYRLKRGGPRAFGTRRPGYYERNGRN